MASLLRSAARSPSLRSKFSLPKPSPTPTPTPSPLRGGRAPPLPTRSVYAALGIVDSTVPLHSAVAAARLKSCLAPDSSIWCWTAQGKEQP